jgi:hypothetical protein
MNQQDELARRIAGLLDEGTDKLSPGRRDALARARQTALARHAGARAHATAPRFATAAGISTEQWAFGVRYLIPLAALVLGLMGVVYMQTNGVVSSIADTDFGLLTDELPINAYLDKDFDSWLKGSSR